MVDKQISLVNSALLLLGAKTINSFDEESTEAITAQSYYERTYRSLIAGFPWKFAVKYTVLAEVAGQVPMDPNFEYLYQLPQDYITALEIQPNQANFKIVGNQLYTAQQNVTLRYVWRVGEELMPILFEQAFMYYLASQMCITLTEDNTKQASMYTQYKDHLKKAKSVDSQQQPQDGFANFPLDDARYGS